MHNNYYFLRQLTRSLEHNLTGTVISECFSQHKDELIIRFETHGDPFFIKASLEPSFSCLSFPDNFHRARKNSVDLLDLLIGQRVLGLRQYANERSFSFDLTNDLTLLFKMHGNRSNIILFEKGNASVFFRNSLVADQELTLESLDRTIDWSHENFLKHRQKLESIYFTFGKVVWKYLKEKDFDSLPEDQQWTMIQEVQQMLEHPSFFITETDGRLSLSLLRTGKIVKEYNDPMRAINDFFFTSIQQTAFAQEKSGALTVLRNKLHNGENYLKKTSQKLSEVESDTNYKTWADLIMANMHLIKLGMDSIDLPDFYRDNHTVHIKLKKDQSAQKNAESYYRKAKNQHIEIQRLKQSLEVKEKEIQQLKKTMLEIESSENLKNLRSRIDTEEIAPSKEKQPPSLPYHEFNFKNFRIWVGRNAQSNDLLTFKHGYKEDLWLHAKDVAGSHVLIKHQAGKNFPKDVIERAAELAAYNSKRKTETLCPVVVTPRKFVRKRKGDPAGMVVVEKEDVIMVTPKLE